MLVYIALSNYLTVAVSTPEREKYFQRKILWAYYLLRNFLYYSK
jgi:hypothetical protein